MDPKIILLFLLIASTIGLSHLSEENVNRARRYFGDLRWREIILRRRRA